MQEEEVISSRENSHDSSQGELRQLEKPLPPADDATSVDYSAGELDEAHSSHDLNGSPGQRINAMENMKTPIKTEVTQVQPPPFYETTLSPIDPTSPGQPEGFDTTVTVEPPLLQTQPQDAREVLQMLSDMASKSSSRSHQRALSEISGTTSIPDIVSEGEVLDIDDATLEAMNFE
jgi:hypothetical protein